MKSRDELNREVMDLVRDKDINLVQAALSSRFNKRVEFRLLSLEEIEFAITVIKQAIYTGEIR